MESLVGGAVLGAVFGELLKAVLDAKHKAVVFKETMDNLEATLKSIDPVIKKIEHHNNKLGRPKEELESLKMKMENGTRLVRECSEIGKLDFVNKIRYQGKLEVLEDSLMRFFVVDLQAQMARDQKETLRKVRKMEIAVKKLPSNYAVGESYNNPEPAEINVESDYDYDDDDAVSVDSVHIHENESNSIYDSDEQRIKIEGMDSSFTQEEKQNQQSSSTTTVIGSQYCAPFPILLEIVRTVKTFSSDKFSVTNVLNDNIIFNLEKPCFSIHERYTLFDHNQNPVVTLHKKKMTAHNRWQVFRGKSEQAADLLFNVKEHHIIQLITKLDVFLATNTDEKVCDFKVKGSWSGGSYVVYAVPSNNIIAQISKYIARGRIGSSKESVVVRVKPNVDSAFIVALIIVICSIA